MSEDPFLLHIADPVHQRLQNRRRERSFVHDEVARRMYERLALMRVQATALLELRGQAPGIDPCLIARYPRAAAFGAGMRLIQKDGGVRARWRRWRHRRAGGDILHLLAAPDRLPFAGQSLDLIWSCLTWQELSDPLAALRESARCLRPGGLLLFSVPGPATADELRRAAQVAGWGTIPSRFADLHHWGDALLAQGFADPVIEQEVLTLRYPDAAALVTEARRLGGNPLRGRYKGLRSRQALARLHAALTPADGPPCLSIEVVYAHAWRPAQWRGVQGEHHVALSSLQRSSAGRRKV